MKKILIQIHTRYIHGQKLAEILTSLRVLASTLLVNNITILKKKEKGYINIFLETSFLSELWLSIQSILCLDLKNRLSNIPFIITCEGNNKWEDYLLLYHFDGKLILDESLCGRSDVSKPYVGVSDRLQYSDKLRLISIVGKSTKLIAHVWIMTNDFMLISEVDDGFVFDGFTILQNWKISELSFDFNFHQKDFYIDVLKIKICPRLINIISRLSLNDFDSIIEDAYRINSFLMVYDEFRYRNSAWLGSIVKITKKYLHIECISSTGENMGIIKFKRKNITKIEFATRYISVFERLRKN
jgi:hypothetical protein